MNKRLDVKRKMLTVRQSVFGKRHCTGLKILCAAALLLASQASFADVTCIAGGSCTQTIPLSPGWNSIYVKVKPDDATLPNLIANFIDGDGAQIKSVWTWLPHRAKVDFVLDASTESLLSKPGWLRYFPESTEESFLTNLFTIDSNRAYLVHLAGTTSENLEITGKPVAPRTRWTPNSLNLTGFHIDQASPPTFLDFFAASSAHDGALIYELDSASGEWQVVDPATAIMQPHAAYWVFSNGGSDYTGPLALELGDVLDFGSSIQSLNLRIRNHSDQPNTVNLKMLANQTPMEFANPDPVSEDRWLPLPINLSIPADTLYRLRLGLRRANVTAVGYSEVLEVRIPGLTRWLIPVVGLAPSMSSLELPKPDTEISVWGDLFEQLLDILVPVAHAQADYAGLWVGVVEINAVSQANNYRRDCVADPAVVATIVGFEPVFIGINPGAGAELCTDANGVPVLLDTSALAPVASPFQFRIIVHQNSSGQVNLLKDVIQMWQNGETDQAGVVTTPGRYVLLTDDALIPLFEGTQLRDGETVGSRTSTVAYDFTGAVLAMTGSLGSALEATNFLSEDAPTNPFRHKFHDRHGQGFDIIRVMSLTFDNSASGALGAGYSELNGSFTETVTGLHKYPIISAGDFTLKRLSDVTELTMGGQL
ncbi:MAG: hypothetical protein JKX81_04830 [Arenicella sp.]|nr:hypothetical protein [Arenicella sp.]